MWNRPILTAAFVVLSAGLVYLNALDNPFVYDDQRLIVENPTIETPSHWRALLLRDATRPLVNISFAIDRTWGDGSPWSFHFTNVVLHMVNVGLLFALVWLVLGDRAGREPPGALLPGRGVAATVAAGLFAVHPMMSQAVGYISGRAEVMCAALLLFALHAARGWFRSRDPFWLVGVLACWVAAMFAKETALMFPLALAIFDRLLYPVDERARWFRVLWLYVPIGILAGVAVMLRLFVFVMIEHPGAIEVTSTFVLVQFVVLHRYLWLLILPAGQTVFHHVAPVVGFLDPRLVIGGPVFVVLAWTGWRTRHREPLVPFGLLWFVLLLIPSMTLVMLNRGEPMAEHRVYAASIGFFAAVGAGAGWLATRLGRARPVIRVTAMAAVAFFVAIMAAQTVLRNAVWDDPVALWTEAASGAPDHWLPNLALGEALQQAGRCPEAIGRFVLAMQDRPQELAIYPKLGVCLLEVGSYDEARATFDELRRRFPASNEASNGLGAVAMLTGRPDEARARYGETLARDPDNVAAHRAMATIEEPVDPAAALAHCTAVARVAPGTPGNDDCISRNRARVDGGGGR